METLTAKAVAAAKPPESGETTLNDPSVPGLALRVTAGGAKSWTLLYRVHGRRRRLTLGRYPDLGLAAARKKARRERGKVADGRDPAREKREAREAAGEAADMTFRALAADFIDRYALGPNVGPRCSRKKKGDPRRCIHGDRLGHLLDANGSPADIWTYNVIEGAPRKRTWSEDRRKLDVDIPRTWRGRPAGDIEEDEFAHLLETKATAAATAANRLRACLRKLYSWARRDPAWKRVISLNPVADLDKPGGAEAPRERVLDADEIRHLWTATEPGSPDDTETMTVPMSAMFRLLLLTGQRVGEIRNMEWTEIDFDNALWIVPASRSKNRKSHRVPLTDPVIAILNSLPRHDDYVLVGARGNRQFYEAADGFGFEDFQPGRDLRSTAATIMAAGGVPQHHVGLVLNHTYRETVTGRHYDRAAYDREKRMALDTLARRVAAILEGGQGADVLPFTAGHGGAA